MFSCFFWRRICLSFLSLFGRFWDHFGAHFHLFSGFGAHFFEKVDFETHSKKPMLFHAFWSPGGPWSDQFGTKIVFFFLMNFSLKFSSILEHFWTTFGALWDPKGPPNPTQNGLRFGRGVQTLKKYDFGTILGAFWDHFGSMLIPFWIVFLFTSYSFFVCWIDFRILLRSDYLHFYIYFVCKT